MAKYSTNQNTHLTLIDDGGLGTFDLQNALTKLKAKRELREISISFKDDKKYISAKPIDSTEHGVAVLRQIIEDNGGVEIQELFIVVYLNRAYDVIGYLKHSKGTTNSTVVDAKIIHAVGICVLAEAMILCHNHPSGNKRPSEADKRITEKIVDGAKLFDMKVLDHVIITKTDSYSFADYGEALSSVPSAYNKKALQSLKKALQSNDLGRPYIPASKGKSLLVDVPDSMGYETQAALSVLESKIGDIDEYVSLKMQYTNVAALHKALSAEQIDAVALAVYNIEQNNQSIIVADQTGIGKGRIAAAMIRYSHVAGYKPIFITQSPNLFSDIYRDLIAIGSEDASQKIRVATGFEEVAIRYPAWEKLSQEEQDEFGTEADYEEHKTTNPTEQKFKYKTNPSYNLKKGQHIVPFIINAKASKTEIKDPDGNVLYEAQSPEDLKKAIAQGALPTGYDVVMLTYSQIAHGGKMDKNLNLNWSPKQQFVKGLAQNNILIMDESHNASGLSKTGIMLRKILASTKGCLFLSATFAKRSDNMPLYAVKTVIQEATLTDEKLVAAIDRGGFPLQEVLAAELVLAGQLVRRERTFEGIEVNYIYLDKTAADFGMEDKSLEHAATSDLITSIIREIIAFEAEYIAPEIAALDDAATGSNGEVEQRKGTKDVGVDSAPFVSKVFQVINQLLFSIKAKEVARRAIQRLKEGKKPVIAFANTMGAFLENLTDDYGNPAKEGSRVNADFSVVLMKALTGTLKYTEFDAKGKAIYKFLDVADFTHEAQRAYYTIAEKIRNAASGIVISPIDLIKQEIEAAGYKVGEVTGRKYELHLHYENGKKGGMGNTSVQPYTDIPKRKQQEETGKVYGTINVRTRENVNDLFRRFNNNEIDVLMINQSGSTGASAHALPTNKVDTLQVKQRVMIVLQAELDINTEVQKRGRINRTGQIFKPIYDYVISAIPAEMRFMMMLQKKLKSLDSNTSANQKNSESLMNVPDFLNKYGNKVVVEYLWENPEFNDAIGDPLKLGDEETLLVPPNAASKVSGRVAILPVEKQEQFYKDILTEYNDYIDYLQETGSYDLEVEVMNLQAKTLKKEIRIVGKGGRSSFGDNTYLETCEVNILKKPFTPEELDALRTKTLQDKTPDEMQIHLESFVKQYFLALLNDGKIKIADKFQKQVDNIPNEKKYKAIEGKDEKLQFSYQRQEEIRETEGKALAKHKKTAQQKYSSIQGFVSFFKVGQQIAFVSDNQPFPIFGVFLGFSVKEKITASSVRLNFAISSSLKSVSIPASQSVAINAIMGATAGANYPKHDWSFILKKWQENVVENTSTGGTYSTRASRFIATGNLLQALGNPLFDKGKLISFNTYDGKQRKGLLLPEGFGRDKDGQKTTTYVQVPILKAHEVVMNLSYGTQISGDAIQIEKRNTDFRIWVSGSRSKGGFIYLDAQVLTCLQNKQFETLSGQMVAMVLPENMLKLFKALGKLNVTLNLSAAQAEGIDLAEDKATDTVPELEAHKPKINLTLIKLKAKALKLKLNLLAI